MLSEKNLSSQHCSMSSDVAYCVQAHRILTHNTYKMLEKKALEEDTVIASFISVWGDTHICVFCPFNFKRNRTRIHAYVPSLIKLTGNKAVRDNKMCLKSFLETTIISIFDKYRVW